MKILVISQYFWPETFIINDLAVSLREKGHSVTVLTGMPNYPSGKLFKGYRLLSPREEYFDGIRIIRTPIFPRGRGRGLHLLMNFTSFILSASLSVLMRCPRDAEVILVFEPSPVTVGLPAILAKRRFGIPIIFWVQDLWPETLLATGAVTSKKLLGMLDRVVQFIYDNSDLILVQSRAFFDPIKRFCSDTCKIKYFPNTAETLYRPIQPRSDESLGRILPRGFRITFAGNIGAAQDFETILKAAEHLKEIKDIQWVILGDGRMYHWVRNEIDKRQLGGTVNLLGRYPSEAMPVFFALSDVLLMTLKHDPIFALTIPSKMQSYMACSKPIVCAMNGEACRIIEEARAGYVCPAGDAAMLADCIKRMYSISAEERRIMGINGRMYFETHFDRAVLLDRFMGWMHSLLRESKQFG